MIFFDLCPIKALNRGSCRDSTKRTLFPNEIERVNSHSNPPKNLLRFQDPEVGLCAETELQQHHPRGDTEELQNTLF